MSFGALKPAPPDARREEREDVSYRARATGPDGREHLLLIVNLSPHGLMARCDSAAAIDDRLQLSLPVVGQTAAEVRWVLGGRIGCKFDYPIDLASYYELVAILVKAPTPAR